jgi:hypothetical protein
MVPKGPNSSLLHVFAMENRVWYYCDTGIMTTIQGSSEQYVTWSLAGTGNRQVTTVGQDSCMVSGGHGEQTVDNSRTGQLHRLWRARGTDR